MESFSQLLVRESANVFCSYVPVSVQDSARFSHRGLLLDSSRHFLSVATLKTMIDTLPMSKFNVLHWHVVDAQSFPFNSATSSNISMGAYAPQFTYKMEDLTEVSNYATDRGVRIVFEIDVPGHAASWGKGYPELLSACQQKYDYNINNWNLNPSLDETYTVLAGILKDIVSASGAKYLHLGGDEVVYGCWANDTSIVTFMQQNDIPTYADLLSYFVLKADDIAANLGTTPIHWEDVFIAGVKTPANTIYNVWTNSTQIAAVTSAGYSVIAAPSDYWYLDHAANTWQVMYGYEPTSNLTSAQAGLIIGGETSMWGEYVDEENIQSKVWPTAAAVGERLWSPATTTDINDALARLLVFRCRMTQRKFRASPVQPGYCAVTYV